MKEIHSEQVEKALSVLKENKDSKLITHLNACVHCGLCGTSCMYYLATDDPKMMPAYKVDIVASIYRRYCTVFGKVLPSWVHAREINEHTVGEMVDALFGSCTMCGRCVKHCSIGVDIPYVVRVGRMMLAALDCVPESLQATVSAAIETGNNMAISTPEFVDTIQWMEEELQDELNDLEAKIPLDAPDKKLLYTLNPREPKFFPLSISAVAKIFYAAKESWTISTAMYDITNYAFFSGDTEKARTIAQRLIDEMQKMGCETLVLGECGHGARAVRWEAPNWLGITFDFKTLNLVELLGIYLREGRIKVDKSLNSKIFTIHDPCNISRNGGLVNELRFVVNQCVENIVEMNPHGEDSFCCGGGGGQLAMSEYNERRLKTGKIKADQIKATGAQVVITPCHNCVDQLMQLNSTYKLGVQIKTVAEVVADAIVI
ncbi:MAG: (Fe-S)-binding protein [Bacteroidetes bacterium]|nr:(Fe-S)-binding protein [Bacteroidota bacterium]MCL2301918.1 (Fe-S)-binding protein [Lentimicrobiaceae bacterium]